MCVGGGGVLYGCHAGSLGVTATDDMVGVTYVRPAKVHSTGV